MTHDIETITFGECVALYGFQFAASILGKTKREQADAIALREAPPIDNTNARP